MWQTIVDLSSLLSFDVNDGIQDDLCSIHYAALDDAQKLICWLGSGMQLIKITIKDANRIVPVHPVVDQHLLGISWKGVVYVDDGLPFGLHSVPIIFTAMADAMARALFFSGIHNVLHHVVCL